MTKRFNFTKRTFINMAVLNIKHSLNLSTASLEALKNAMVRELEEKAPVFFTSKEAKLLMSILTSEALKPSFILNRLEVNSFKSLCIRCTHIFVGRRCSEIDKIGHLPGEDQQVIFNFISHMLKMIHDHCSDDLKVLKKL